MGDLWNTFHIQDEDAIKNAKRVANGTIKLLMASNIFLVQFSVPIVHHQNKHRFPQCFVYLVHFRVIKQVIINKELVTKTLRHKLHRIRNCSSMFSSVCAYWNIEFNAYQFLNPRHNNPCTRVTKRGGHHPMWIWRVPIILQLPPADRSLTTYPSSGVRVTSI